MLKLENVSASYGSVPAITNVSIEIGEGEAVGLLGANGAGKSTTLRAISGLVKLSTGSVTFAGTDVTSLPGHRIPELGIAHVPEGRQVFPEMTVQENLEIGAFVPTAKAERARTMELVYEIKGDAQSWAIEEIRRVLRPKGAFLMMEHDVPSNLFLRALFYLRLTFAGTDVNSLPPYRIPELGIAHVPEGRQVFPEMTVQENLEIGAFVPKAKAERARTMELVYEIFPRLAERRKQLAGTMSGGEQQMLAVGRGLMLKPRLLMLDEPSLGLAPVMTDVTFEKIGEIHKMGTAILLVEQNVSRALSLVQRAYVLESGNVIMHGSSSELAGNKQVQAAYLGI